MLILIQVGVQDEMEWYFWKGLWNPRFLGELKGKKIMFLSRKMDFEFVDETRERHMHKKRWGS